MKGGQIHGMQVTRIQGPDFAEKALRELFLQAMERFLQTSGLTKAQKLAVIRRALSTL